MTPAQVIYAADLIARLKAARFRLDELGKIMSFYGLTLEGYRADKTVARIHLNPSLAMSEAVALATHVEISDLTRELQELGVENV